MKCPASYFHEDNVLKTILIIIYFIGIYVAKQYSDEDCFLCYIFDSQFFPEWLIDESSSLVPITHMIIKNYSIR